MSWATLLAALAAPLAKRVLIGLGFGVVTYTAYAAVLSQISNWITSNLSGLAGDVYKLMAMIGLVDALGIWLAAFSWVIAMAAAKKLQLVGS